MKKLIALSLLSAGLAFAQTGLQGGSDGLHQVNAKTLGQWNFSFGLGGDFALDSWSLSRGGTYTDANGKTSSFNADDASLSGNVNLGIGLLSFWDIGASLPVYYDHANSDEGSSVSGEMWSSGMGDVDIWTKLRVPFDDKFFFGVATFLEMYVPSGTDGAGVRPRHAWYLDDNGATSAYSGEGMALSASLAFTLDFTKFGFPLRWNLSGGFLKALGHDEANVVSYATALNLVPGNAVDFFVEFSGEMRVEKTDYPRDPLVDPMLVTPGFRAHLGDYVDLTMGVDFSSRFFRNPGYEADDEKDNCSNYQVQFRNNGKSATYCYASTPIIAGVAALVWHFDARKKAYEDPTIVKKGDKLASKQFNDSDGDGIPDINDKCPYSKAGAKVDSLGCAVDTDGDGVIDIDDKCPDTPKGVKVNDVGCVGDSDDDGIMDDLDKCPATPKGFAVDSTGCPFDADKDGVADMLDKCPNTPDSLKVTPDGCPVDTDKDGVADYLDKCQNTPFGAKVDSVGCPTDGDKDGVFDGIDKCPNTKKGAKVDTLGCEPDFDKDGVPDGVDRCPNTPAGFEVDSLGCVKDEDKDGVPDKQDQCPKTPKGITVDSVGCALDFDKDGVPDQIDQCPNTPVGAKVDSTGCPVDTDKDGVPDGLDQCPKTPKGAPVDSTGCSLDSDGDLVPDYKDKCPGTPKGISVDARGCSASKKEDLEVLGRGLTFEKNSATLSKGSATSIANIVALMKKVPNLKLEIQGYVGGKGNDERNKKLAQDRAITVQSTLMSKGVDASRLRTASFSGEEAAKKSGKAERIELVVFQ